MPHLNSVHHYRLMTIFLNLLVINPIFDCPITPDVLHNIHTVSRRYRFLLCFNRHCCSCHPKRWQVAGTARLQDLRQSGCQSLPDQRAYPGQANASPDITPIFLAFDIAGSNTVPNMNGDPTPVCLTTLANRLIPYMDTVRGRCAAGDLLPRTPQRMHAAPHVTPVASQTRTAPDSVLANSVLANSVLANEPSRQEPASLPRLYNILQLRQGWAIKVMSHRNAPSGRTDNLHATGYACRTGSTPGASATTKGTKPVSSRPGVPHGRPCATSSTLLAAMRKLLIMLNALTRDQRMW